MTIRQNSCFYTAGNTHGEDARRRSWNLHSTRTIISPNQTNHRGVPIRYRLLERQKEQNSVSQWRKNLRVGDWFAQRPSLLMSAGRMFLHPSRPRAFSSSPIHARSLQRLYGETKRHEHPKTAMTTRGAAENDDFAFRRSSLSRALQRAEDAFLFVVS